MSGARRPIKTYAETWREARVRRRARLAGVVSRRAGRGRRSARGAGRLRAALRRGGAGSGLSFHAPDDAAGLVVVERVDGDATMDFGAPSIAPAPDREPLSARQLTRLRTLLEAGWRALDRVAKAADGVALSKGPRGGGRELDAILEHVAGAEGAYGAKLAAPRPKLGGLNARAALAVAPTRRVPRRAHRRRHPGVPRDLTARRRPVDPALRPAPRCLARARPRVGVIEDRMTR